MDEYGNVIEEGQKNRLRLDGLIPRCMIQIPLGNLSTKVVEVWKLSKL